ncbi:MAG TPA: hypothetical protein VFU13_06040 [Steroidobacteraceae bacterium]|nr:hypothetical protein [Steroidobacteraceae bacterium]
MTDPQYDPFAEKSGRLRRHRHSVLGIPVCFESDSPDLLRLADQAFAGPARKGAGPRSGFTVRLRLANARARVRRMHTPAEPRLFSGGGALGSFIDAANFAWVCPELRRGFVSVSREMLRFEYHVRYELIEFAVLTLLARARRLVPLHAACFGRRGRALLLIGNSGAGKSTTCLQALSDGMEFVSEDSVFVRPDTLAAAGLGAFLHVCTDGPRFATARVSEALRTAPRIRRRSGVRKLEIDLRRREFSLAARPLKIVAVVILSRRAAGKAALLRRRNRAQLRAALTATQPYASSQSGWNEFRARAGNLPAYEMRRAPPAQTMAELRRLLAPARAGR